MGRDYTPTYVVQIKETPPPFETRIVLHTPGEWRVRAKYGARGYGKPTEENLERYVMDYAASLKLGGVNEHLSKDRGYIPYPTSAYIKHQKTGRIMATWKAGAFQVFP